MKMASERVLFHFQAFVVWQEWRGKEEKEGMKRGRDGEPRWFHFVPAPASFPQQIGSGRLKVCAMSEKKRETEGGRYV